MNLPKGLFNSKAKKKLLGVFFQFPGRSFHPDELKDMLKVSKNAQATALRELKKAGVVKHFTKKRKRYYQINRHLKWYEEIASLTSDQKQHKDTPANRRLKRFKRAKLIVLTGIFTGQPHLQTDVLIVSTSLSPKGVSRAMSDLKDMAGQEVNYTIMDKEEFEYRRHMQDRFIRDILDNPHIEVLNKLKKKKRG